MKELAFGFGSTIRDRIIWHWNEGLTGVLWKGERLRDEHQVTGVPCCAPRVGPPRPRSIASDAWRQQKGKGTNTTGSIQTKSQTHS